MIGEGSGREKGGSLTVEWESREREEVLEVSVGEEGQIGPPLL